MPRLRLNGLILFVTAIFLGLAAMATQTTHIQVKSPTRSIPDPRLAQPLQDGTQPDPLWNSEAANSEVANSEVAANKTASPDLQFVSVPITIPLALAAVLGLSMWFIPSFFATQAPTRRRRSRKRR